MLWMGIWVYPYTLTSVQVGVYFWKTGVSLSPSDIAMWLLRLQEASDCIPHQYHMYKKCFSILICCEWAYGSTLTLLCLCRLGIDFGKIGVGLSPNDVVMWWLRLQTPMDCISHQFYIFRSVIAPWYAVNGHMCPPLHYYACAGWGLILPKLG